MLRPGRCVTQFCGWDQSCASEGQLSCYSCSFPGKLCVPVVAISLMMLISALPFLISLLCPNWLMMSFDAIFIPFFFFLVCDVCNTSRFRLSLSKVTAGNKEPASYRHLLGLGCTAEWSSGDEFGAPPGLGLSQSLKSMGHASPFMVTTCNKIWFMIGLFLFPGKAQVTRSCLMSWTNHFGVLLVSPNILGSQLYWA